MERFNSLIHEDFYTRKRRRSIIKVPPYIKSSNPDAYIPHVFSIGPYHHGTEHLMPMEAYKRKCVASFMQRSGCNPQSCYDRFREETPRLMEYYEFLDDKWRVDENSYFELMLVDGCFLLECFYWAAIGHPVNNFLSPLNNLLRGSRIATIRRDMILIENQLPIKVLQILLELCSAEADPVFEDLEGLLMSFFGQTYITVDASCVHLPDVLRLSMITPGSHERRIDAGPEFPPATLLSLAGLKFEKSETPANRSMDVLFDERRGLLSLPFICVDEITEAWFLNLMALERCEVMESNGVSSYISFMGMLIRSAQDVKLLRKHGIIIDNKLEKNDKAIAKLFAELATNPVNSSDDSLYERRYALHEWSASSRRKLNVRFAEWGSSFVETYCKNPWSAIGLVAGIILLIATLAQTYCAVLQLYQNDDSPTPPTPPHNP
ncbi:UPF0481-like protein [Cinnamomum micranthum f. kanehirae]|uniref:UPF0481-like protein n=1 Tax=Cinnamomum micranthum f. kanehirae TaxID=337451 RepID=A0A3S3N135_9MAGN|nr:UPF0481-like protein [Cinnamomum micranthum f. kanehirae]